MTYYHGTLFSYSFFSIIKYGFQNLGGRAYLGRGVYLTQSLDIAYAYASWFEDPEEPLLGCVLQINLKKSARIIDISDKPKTQVIRYLKREFGARILNPKSFSKSIPNNKKLKQNELIELAKYFHCHQVDDGPDYSREMGASKLAHYLRRYKIDGFGDPKGEAGILVLNPAIIDNVFYVNPLSKKVCAPCNMGNGKTIKNFVSLSFDPETNFDREVDVTYIIDSNFSKVYLAVFVRSQGLRMKLEYSTDFFRDMEKLGIERDKQLDMFANLEFKVPKNYYDRSIEIGTLPYEWEGKENIKKNIVYIMDEFFEELNNGRYAYSNGRNSL